MEIKSMTTIGNLESNNHKVKKFKSSDIDISSFVEKFLIPKIPMVVIDGVKEWKAYKDWSLSYLKEKLGTLKCSVKYNEHGIFDYNEDAETGEVWGREMTAERAINLIDSEKGAVCYIQQTSIRTSFPSLLSDLERPYLLSPTVLDKTINLWLGGGRCKSPLHFDHSDNFFMQIFGKKRLTIFAPTESDFLYPATGKKLPHCSLVNFFNPNIQKFPLYKNAKSMEIILEAGQMIYIPKGWWHAVESMSVSASVNYWW